MSPGRGRKRKFHQVGCLLFFFSTLADILTSLQSYRPPTPPLPAVNKEQLPLDDEIELPKPGNPVRVSVTLLWHAINLAADILYWLCEPTTLFIGTRCLQSQSPILVDSRLVHDGQYSTILWCFHVRLLDGIL